MSIGVPYRMVYMSCPNDLEPFVEAYKRKQYMIDHTMWVMGTYVNRAVGVAVSQNLHGRKSRIKYFDMPILEKERIEKNSQSEHDEIEGFKVWASVFNAGFDKRMQMRNEE